MKSGLTQQQLLKKETILDNFFNDSVSDVNEQLRRTNTQKKREEFIQAMKDTLVGDQDGEKFGTLTSYGQSGQPLDQFGKLTQHFKQELLEIKEEELEKLEEAIKNARQPTDDLFGIARRFCNVCEEGCIGYQPHKMMFPSQLSHQFPTFCKNCRCPAHFHQVALTAQDIVFPEELADIIKQHNLEPKDLNYNCVLIAFQVRDEDNEISNLDQLMSILFEEGLEVLSMDKRMVEFEEAIYLKGRMVGQTENVLLDIIGSGAQDRIKGAEIRKQGQAGSITVAKTGKRDMFTMQKHASEKEQFITKQSQKILGQKVVLQEVKTVTEQLMGETLNQRTTLNDRDFKNFNSATMGPSGAYQNSIARTSNVTMSEIDPRETFRQETNQQIQYNNNSKTVKFQGYQSTAARSGTMANMQFSRRTTVLPHPKSQSFKIKVNKITANNTQKKNILHTIPEYMQEEILAQEIESSPVLKEILNKDILLLAIGSSTFQNLEQKVRGPVLQKIQHFLPSHEMPLLYLSDNRIMAMEDCVAFFPQLFRLVKSVIVSEPAQEYLSKDIDYQQHMYNADAQMQELDRKITQLSGLQEAGFTLGERQIEDTMGKTLGNIEGNIDGNIRGQNDIIHTDNDYNNNNNEDADDTHYFKLRNTMTRKFSTLTRKTLKNNDHQQKTMQKTQIKNNQSQSLDNSDVANMSWVERARLKTKQLKKDQKMIYRKNKILYNFGVMQDFFNYSAVSIQNALKEVDMSNPTSKNMMSNSQTANQAFDSKPTIAPTLCNIFAISKVGLPNLIFPTSLDVKLSNHQSYTSYTYLCDNFFPTLSSSQHQVIILRPLIVKNGLNDMFVQIIKANDFVVLKRKIRHLKKTEVIYIARVEGIIDQNAQLYYNMMMDGPVEIIVMTKVGAVHDGLTLVNGGGTYSRKRVAQANEGSTNIRSNVDSINALFELSPFSSFGEFIDVEDFVVSHSKLEKYKKLYKNERKHNSLNRVDDEMYFNKIDKIRKELNLFSRHFNLAAFAAPTEYEAHKQMCVLMPETATIEEVVLLLNPLYNHLFESSTELLTRMGFKILEHKVVNMRASLLEEAFKEKLANNQVDQRLMELMTDQTIHMWHLTKISADREVRATYKDAQIDYEDYFKVKVKKGPFKPLHLPYIFIFMDTPTMFERSLQIIYPPQIVKVTGQDMVYELSNKEKVLVLEIALQVTVGDKIRRIFYDQAGQVIKDNGNNESALHLMGQREPQLYLLMSNPKDSSAVHYVVESAEHGLFEIRFHRLTHRGDSYNLSTDPTSINLSQLPMQLFAKMQALNCYYNEVNKVYYNVCPAFYRFKVCPLMPPNSTGSTGEQSSVKEVNRVYEVEEHMGRMFIEEIAKMHQNHLKMLSHQRQFLTWQFQSEEEQKSLPAYIWGVRLAEMCKNLETIKPTYITGAGKIIFEDGTLKSEIPKVGDYYEQDQKRYQGYLNEFKKGWHYYLSVLETDIIEQKLNHILKSFTFKYSRMPQFISMIPDHLDEINVRISERMKVLTETGLIEKKEKFFTLLKEELIGPHREENASKQVESMMYTLQQESAKSAAQKQFKSQGTSLQQVLEEVNTEAPTNYSIHHDCCLVGMEVAKRPKYQLIASLVYLINFKLRKIDRRSELFENQQINRQSSNSRYGGGDIYGSEVQSTEQDYDQVLDILVKSIADNYGIDRDEYNLALDMVSLQRGHETEFEKLMREKSEYEEKQRNKMKQSMMEEQRKMRTTMTMDQLMKTQCDVPQREYEMKQRELLKKFVDTKGHTDKDGEGFLEVLRQTQSMIGPHSIKLAHEYLTRGEREMKSRQEKISFVKMEYFLYGITEAQTIVQELKQLEERINQMQDQFEQMRVHVIELEKQSQSLQLSQASNVMYGRTNRQQESDKRHEELFNLEKQIERLRYTIGMKETELVLVFRELMGWDYIVPDYYFDLQLMQGKNKNDKAQDIFYLPLKTFWRPIFFDEPVENDLFNEKYHIRLRDYTLEPPETLLAPSLCRQPFSRLEQTWRERQGITVSNLRPHDFVEPAQILKFDKFESRGEMNQLREIADIHKTIKFKTTKDPYQTYMPF